MVAFCRAFPEGQEDQCFFKRIAVIKLLDDAKSTKQHCQAEQWAPHGVKALTGFLFFNLIYGVVFATHFAHFFRFSLTQNDTPHFSLILLVTAYLMYGRRREVLAHATCCFRGGIPLVLLGALCYLSGVVLRPALGQNDFFALTMFATLVVWVGGFVTFFGLRAARMVRFPLAFLLFMVPIPEALLFHIITALQGASAEVVALLFRLTPVPMFREGTVFALPGIVIEVARECSSIRSSWSLLITCVLANHLLLRRWWSQTVVLLLVFPLAVFKNGVRIVTLTLLTLYVDDGFLHGRLHTRGGVVFFGMALLVLLPIVLGLRKLEARQRAPGPSVAVCSEGQTHDV